MSKSDLKELCIVGKTETENIGIDKVVKNLITNKAINYLILAGKDTEVHQSGQTMLALWKNGVDKNNKIIGSYGKRPVLANTSAGEIEAFRKQINVIDMIGCEDIIKIITKFSGLKNTKNKSCSCTECCDSKSSSVNKQTEITTVKETAPVKLDKSGYFVVMPQKEKKIILVEYYSYKNELLHVLEGNCAKDLYLFIIKKGWVSQLDHAAYLGKELEKAELSLEMDFKYIQDGA